ncbi:hypothetical protein K432DRAFT_383542 [Lepidopterella palustris CBS 459.81]|uniref:Uncharacterized protein n=1 Tax=Lepidopterella palustris CBS 459.81 TaxID=1314670 RepID=A0A8E2E7U3_9PEZI|nr:hypothetical protein K432DRAFT_383542 [Lepidopterella palustris CBS 459.81]
MRNAIEILIPTLSPQISLSKNQSVFIHHPTHQPPPSPPLPPPRFITLTTQTGPSFPSSQAPIWDQTPQYDPPPPQPAPSLPL